MLLQSAYAIHRQTASVAHASVTSKWYFSVVTVPKFSLTDGHGRTRRKNWGFGFSFGFLDELDVGRSHWTWWCASQTPTCFATFAHSWFSIHGRGHAKVLQMHTQRLKSPNVKKLTNLWNPQQCRVRCWLCSHVGLHMSSSCTSGDNSGEHQLSCSNVRRHTSLHPVWTSFKA